MRTGSNQTPAIRRSPRSTGAICVLAASCALCVSTGPTWARPQAAGPHARAAVHAICSGPNSAHLPCRFGTPSGNIRCLWTPVPNNVACVLRATGRAYRLRPTGRARRIRLTLRRHGVTLPTNQQIVFPGSLSCRDTRRTMVCNQDFALGAFTLAPRGSHSS